MPAEEVDDSRATVRTYVPAYQREEWDDHADELGMSRSEFVRTMVQAGRRGFDEYAPDEGGPGSDPAPGTAEQPRSPDANPRGSGLEDRVLDILSGEEYLSWNQLVEELTDDVERRLEDTLQNLQSSGRVVHSPRNGGYVLDE